MTGCKFVIKLVDCCKMKVVIENETSFWRYFAFNTLVIDLRNVRQNFSGKIKINSVS